MKRGHHFGVTGHQNLAPATRAAIQELLGRILQDFEHPVGCTALAEGADQLFAQAILSCGGSLEVILPSSDYEETFQSPEALEQFRILLELADNVVPLSFDKASEEAFWSAGKEVVRKCDTLIAVWDGKPAAGLGGTGDVVQFARQAGKEVRVIWPEGSIRI